MVMMVNKNEKNFSFKSLIKSSCLFLLSLSLSISFCEDCGDNSDELNCPKLKCKDDNFKCGDGTCITQKWVCDGDLDCADGGSDERVSDFI